MPRYDGIVSLDEGEIEVVVDLDPDRVHLRAGDHEIGNWAPGECAIASLGNGAYSITAENQSIRFVPSNPRLFADGLNHGTGYGVAPPPPEATRDRQGRHTKLPHRRAESIRETEAPPPKPMTVVLFYGLAGLTGGLGIWALFSII